MQELSIIAGAILKILWKIAPTLETLTGSGALFITLSKIRDNL